MKRATIGKLLMDKNNNAPVLELFIEGTDKKIYLWIGACEAWALAMSIENLHLIRPMTHDLIINAVEALGGSLERVVIHSIENGTFLANLIIKSSAGIGAQQERVEQYIEIDSRPSDCLVIANKLSLPVYVTSEVLLEAAVGAAVSSVETGDVEKEKREFKTFIEDFDLNELRNYLDKKDEDEDEDEEMKD